MMSPESCVDTACQTGTVNKSTWAHEMVRYSRVHGVIEKSVYPWNCSNVSLRSLVLKNTYLLITVVNQLK